jgi:hypothetical protein
LMRLWTRISLSSSQSGPQAVRAGSNPEQQQEYTLSAASSCTTHKATAHRMNSSSSRSCTHVLNVVLPACACMHSWSMV